MDLRGYDSYVVSLGDQMRGERACLGKTIEDAERDMRIKAHVLEAIENADLEGFPNRSVIAGYVRSYARYLAMDPDECFARFCEESGYESPNALTRVGDRRRPGAPVLSAPAGTKLGASRFAQSVPTRRSRPVISLGALASTFALCALTGGLAYGAYALLQDLQRVGFAPLPAAPEVVASAPLIDMPAGAGTRDARPTARDYSGSGALAAIVLPEELSPVATPRREGPISAINPETAGLFKERHIATPAHAALGDVEPNIPVDLVSAELGADAAASARDPRGTALLASEAAWVRVSDGKSVILWEGILGAGESFTVPEHAADPVLKTGNAGGVFIIVDGVGHGPVGESGRVANGVSLQPDDVRSSIPIAATGRIDGNQLISDQVRADASSSLR